MKKDNKTKVEKDDNATKIECDGASDESGQKETQAGRISAKTIKFGGSVYEVVQRLDVASSEADLYLIKGASAELFVLKYYRPKIEPKPAVIELMKSFSGRGAVRIIETGRESGRFYEIQEYAAHGTLSDFMKSNKPIPREFLTAFIKNAAECLFEIHSKNLIHRDIKPENILVRNIEPLDIAFTDFGISSISRLSLHRTNMNRTILYSSPESMSGVISKGTDYWSLGMILLEMVAGTNPFEGVADKVVMFTLATKTVPGVMELKSEFSTLIKGLLTRNPKKRWGHKEIAAWLGGEKNIPVFFGEMSDDAIQLRSLHPYKFDGNNYFTLRELMVPMAKKWDLAAKDFESGAIRNWVARELGDKEMLAVIEDLASDKSYGSDEKLFEFFCRIDGSFPFIFRGTLITRESLIELASQIIKNSASPEEKKFMRDIFKLNIIKKYSELNNDDSIYNLFGGVMETCVFFSEPEDHAVAVLVHFVDEYRRSMIEKAREIFENCYILDKPRGAEHEDLMDNARKISDGGKYSAADLIRGSKIGKLDHISKINFDSVVTGLKNKFIELDEENRIKSYKEMFSDDDWKVVTELARNNTVEYSRSFYEKISGIKKLLDGGPPLIDRKISEIYSKDNYVVVSELPPEIFEQQAPPKSPDRSMNATLGEVIGRDRAKPRARLNALLGDMGLAMLSFLLSVTILIFTSNEPVSLALIEAFHNRFFLGFFLLYIPISEYLFSASPGKVMFNIAVAGPDDRKISFFRSFFRSLTRFAILSFYGCLTLSIYKFLLNPNFPASYLDYRSILFFMAFYAGGIFDYIFMYFRRSQSPSYETITGCSVVERRYNTGWLPTIFMTVISAAIIVLAWGCLLAPHFDLKTMSFERYTWRYFIDPGSENGVKYNAGKFEIIIAADRGELDLVKLLLYSHPEYAGVTDENGFSALFFAAQKGNDEIVKLLLDNKAEVNSVGNLMETPLTAACATGNSKIVKMLCAKKADVNFRNAQGQTPLIIAVMGKFSDAAKILVESSANLELKDENGFTALMMAAFTSDTRMFEYLLSKGADINAVDLKGHTLLMIAAVKNNFEIAKMLVNMECNINARGGASEATALIAAIQYSNSKIAEMLIDKS
ncbi:MAG TPA: ankyrin repeat domain-containing protein, partial [Candidatus Wallbacteria bacterium]|nr:ankyrin repeat domain-containing protein [Candidatus Wallbacteria bacterium]